MFMLHSVLQYTQTLTLVTQWYNKLHTTILPVELGLVKDEMDGMRQQLNSALQKLTWDQDDLWDYIQSTREMAKVVKISGKGFELLNYCTARSPISPFLGEKEASCLRLGQIY